jgi:hypothetical protein
LPDAIVINSHNKFKRTWEDYKVYLDQQTLWL